MAQKVRAGAGKTEYFDAESGLSYDYFRIYEPASGRYLKSDPTGLEGGLNLYAYTKASPLRHVDPLGLADISLGQGYTARIDSFNYGGGSSFEIHVYDPKGKEVGVMGPDAEWINKHGHEGAPEGVPREVCEGARGHVAEQLRARGFLPPKGTVNIKGQNFGRFLPIGPTARGMGPLMILDVILQAIAASRECPYCI